MNLNEVVGKALFLSELSGNERAIYEFRDAKKGKSGYSFGRCQFDVSNNMMAATILLLIGFTQVEIGKLKLKQLNAAELKGLNAKLQTPGAKLTIDRYDAAQVDECVNHVREVAKARGIHFATNEAFVHVCDYHNQLYFSSTGPLAAHLVGLGRPVTSQDFLDYMLASTWGKKEPEDVERRFNNVAKVCREMSQRG